MPQKYMAIRAATFLHGSIVEIAWYIQYTAHWSDWNNFLKMDSPRNSRESITPEGEIKVIPTGSVQWFFHWRSTSRFSVLLCCLYLNSTIQPASARVWIQRKSPGPSSTGNQVKKTKQTQNISEFASIHLYLNATHK